jgi:hypothetical protein
MTKDDEPRSAEERVKDQEEIAAQRAAAQSASELAARRGPVDRSRLLEQISDPDIFNDDDAAYEELLGMDFARPHILGQKEEADVWRDRWLNENEADRIIHEQNPGRLCFGPFLELAQGVHNRDSQAQQPLTDEGKRKTREALNAKTAFQTMAKNGRTFKGLTEIVTTSKVERDGDESGSSGRLGKIREKLFG